ncbi:MAG: hypothetical protein WCT45_01640 [Candidatus Paceibacterota bacterium]|jgi:cytidine deaminase
MAHYTDTDLESIVQAELQNARAPLTGILVASALLTEKELYLGHNEEKGDPIVFEHSETVGLQKALAAEGTPKILKIVMAGGGTVDKFKFYTPCFSCTHALAPFMADGATVVLTALPNINETLVLTFDELFASYAQVPYSKINTDTASIIRSELGTKTVLEGEDIDFIADLTALGLSEGIEIFLTGSASGRGGVSTLLNKKTNHKYRDIDIIAVIDKDFSTIEAKIEEMLRDHYGFFTKIEKPILPYQNKQGVVFKKSNYYCGEGKSPMIDFSFSKSFSGTLAYHAYEIKNWFHQLT